MQLYAKNQHSEIIFARRAEKKANYSCLECNGVVRRRGGIHRQDHFYHLDPSPSCRQNGKSMEHLQVQFFLHALLPAGECFLEYRFNEINRIADVVWLPKKIIFEVQCSPITAEEFQKRNQDYLLEGFKIVWIFHDRTFKQWRLSAAEMCAHVVPHYFTNINAEGYGHIYDQFYLVERGIRKQHLPSVRIQMTEPKMIQQNAQAMFSEAWLNLVGREWPFHFSGDVLDRCSDEEYANQIRLLLKEKKQPQRNPIWLQPFLMLRHFYRVLFRYILEKSCR